MIRFFFPFYTKCPSFTVTRPSDGILHTTNFAPKQPNGVTESVLSVHSVALRTVLTLKNLYNSKKLCNWSDLSLHKINVDTWGLRWRALVHGYSGSEQMFLFWRFRKLTSSLGLRAFSLNLQPGFKSVDWVFARSVNPQPTSPPTRDHEQKILSRHHKSDSMVVWIKIELDAIITIEK